MTRGDRLIRVLLLTVLTVCVLAAAAIAGELLAPPVL